MCNYFKIHMLVEEKKSFQGFSTFSSGGHLVQQSKMVCRILVEGHQRNICLVKAGKSFKVFFLFFSSGGHFVQRIETV